MVTVVKILLLALHPLIFIGKLEQEPLNRLFEINLTISSPKRHC